MSFNHRSTDAPAPGYESARSAPQEDAGIPRSRTRRGTRSGRRGRWALTAVVLIAVGTVASVLAARSVAHGDHARERLAFRFAAAQVAATLKLAIQHEEDLIDSGRAFIVSNPRASAAQFALWARSVAALQRYPELQDIGLLVLVPGAQLSAFRARMLVHPILPPSRQPAESRGTFEVLPQGQRPYYCLAAAGVVRSRVAILPPGLDYCALEPGLVTARESGQSSYVPFREGGATTLGVQTPIYRGGVPPAGVAARRSSFVGWLAESLTPETILGAALAGHPAMAVTFRYRAGRTDVTFDGGVRPAAAQRSTVDLHNGWTVESFGVVGGGGVLGDAHALTLLIGGAALSLLLGALTFVLGTGRTRAMSIVREKTRELSYQALHDALTGLPNRMLVIQRADEMLARQGMVAAAMFVDLDGFKQVNDRFGHAAGDELLRVTGARLRNAVRQEDIVGRLGGDEFVVLLDSATGESQPDRVAERLIAVAREPVSLNNGAALVSVSASVGIAVGRRDSVDAMLRDADLALYAAKDAGKDCYILFEPEPDGGAPMPRAAARAGGPARGPGVGAC